MSNFTHALMVASTLCSNSAMLSLPLVQFPLPCTPAAAVHRRGWGSLYAALSKGSIDAEALQDLLARHPPSDLTSCQYALQVVVGRHLSP